MGAADWQAPKFRPAEILGLYAKVLTSVPSARSWAIITGAQVHFYTVIDLSVPFAEDALYLAEQTMVETVGPDNVVFHVYPSIESLPTDPSMIPVDGGQLVA